MIDSITKNRVIVELDDKGCPFIEITEYNDADELEDILSEEFNLIFLVSHHETLKKYGGKRFHFSSLVDQGKLQKVLDSIELN
ncbi:hypothetical protein [Enterovibrio calviensis]|uniref:hypothetical protein n=1 Tax=Enterovibrio calviensis TaxID=91359 RepID=UPI003736076E